MHYILQKSAVCSALHDTVRICGSVRSYWVDYAIYYWKDFAHFQQYKDYAVLLLLQSIVQCASLIGM